MGIDIVRVLGSHRVAELVVTLSNLGQAMLLHSFWGMRNEDDDVRIIVRVTLGLS